MYTSLLVAPGRAPRNARHGLRLSRLHSLGNQHRTVLKNFDFGHLLPELDFKCSVFSSSAPGNHQSGAKHCV